MKISFKSMKILFIAANLIEFFGMDICTSLLQHRKLKDASSNYKDSEIFRFHIRGRYFIKEIKETMSIINTIFEIRYEPDWQLILKVIRIMPMSLFSVNSSYCNLLTCTARKELIITILSYCNCPFCKSFVVWWKKMLSTKISCKAIDVNLRSQK